MQLKRALSEWSGPEGAWMWAPGIKVTSLCNSVSNPSQYAVYCCIRNKVGICLTENNNLNFSELSVYANYLYLYIVHLFLKTSFQICKDTFRACCKHFQSCRCIFYISWSSQVILITNSRLSIHKTFLNLTKNLSHMSILVFFCRFSFFAHFLFLLMAILDYCLIFRIKG